jgi:hypothetical protein
MPPRLGNLIWRHVLILSRELNHDHVGFLADESALYRSGLPDRLFEPGQDRCPVEIHRTPRHVVSTGPPLIFQFDLDAVEGHANNEGMDSTTARNTDVFDLSCDRLLQRRRQDILRSKVTALACCSPNGNTLAQQDIAARYCVLVRSGGRTGTGAGIVRSRNLTTRGFLLVHVHRRSALRAGSSLLETHNCSLGIA